MIEEFLEKQVLGIIHFTKKNPKKVFVIISIPLIILSTINFLDFYLTSGEEMSDEITSFRRLKNNKGHSRGFKYVTKRNLKFALEDKYVQGNKIKLKHTLLFKTVTSIKTEKRDYSKYLISNLNGVIKYFHLVFLISLGVSVYIFSSKKQITNNTYLNIWIFNSFMLFILLYSLISN